MSVMDHPDTAPSFAAKKGSKIEWTGHTWNPIVGCSLASPGCTNCYAMKMAARLEIMGGHGMRGLEHYRGSTKKTMAGPVWTGKVAFSESALSAPMTRGVPTLYFVNSMSDLFHEDVPDEWILKVLDVVRSTGHDGGSNCGRIRSNGKEGQHTYQVLTKRPARMRDVMSRLAWDGETLHLRSDASRARVILRNLWLGVSCEDQRRADERIPDLLATPAAVRFVSAEPLLGPIDFASIPKEGARLDWIIVGGESGPGSRPMQREWADSIVDQCKAAGIAVFVKQLGAAYSDEKNGVAGAALKVPKSAADLISRRLKNRKGADMTEWPESLRVREMPHGRRDEVIA